MELIDKEKVVEEIERIKKEECPTDSYEGRCKMLWFEQFSSFLDTLEVKEVDLEKETKKWWEERLHLNPESQLWMDAHQSIVFAKHFFELGLNARTDKELVEEVYSHLDGIKDTADRMTSGNFMHNRAAIKFSANTIAKVLELMGLKVKKGE